MENANSSISHKLKLSLSTKSLESSLILSNLNEDNILQDLITIFSKQEKEDIIKLNHPNILFFYLLNHDEFHQILFNDEKNVEITSEHLKNKISNYFYLVLLIDKEQEIVNYEYEINIITDLFVSLNKKSKGEFYDLIIVIIILKLINNYRSSNIYSEDNDKEKLDTIKQEVKEKIKKLDHIIKSNSIEIDENNIDDIEEINLEDLYIKLIINELRKLGKMEEDKENQKEDFTRNFAEQIGLEKIELTKVMYDKIKEYFDSEDIPKITTIDDLYDCKIINYYYNLCKYILKQNIYVYHINFLYEARKKIIEIINKLNISSINLPKKEKINKIDQDKFQYMIEFMTDSKYYYEYLNNKGQYEILSFKKIIMKTKINNDNEEKKSKQLIELSNGYFLKINVKKHIFIYDNNYIQKDSDELEDFIYNIGEIENDNGLIKFCLFGLNKLYFYEYNINNNLLDENGKKEKPNPNQYKNIFKIKNKKNNEIEELSSGALGIYLEDKNINNNKVNYISGINITDNLFAFYSNTNLKNGKDIIVLLQINTENNKTKNTILKEIEEIKIKKEGGEEEKIKFSFPFHPNALNLINVDDNYKILLCVRQSHTPNKKNGIIILKINTNQNDFNTYPNYPAEFFCTDDFEVFCFCLIYQDINKKFAYFLVGGLENDKKRETIKLYKITYNEINKKAEIEFIQDAIENFDSFQGFDGIINNIIKPKKNNRDIIVNCFEGTTFLFSLPKTDFYIKKFENDF